MAERSMQPEVSPRRSAGMLSIDHEKRVVMRLASSQLIFWSALLLLLLAGCSSTVTQHSPIHGGTSPTFTIQPTQTNTPLPFLRNDHDPFQATFLETSS